MEKISELLNVVDKARNWPELRGIHDMAMAELKKANEEANKELAARAEDAKAKAAEEAKAKVQELEDLREQDAKPTETKPYVATMRERPITTTPAPEVERKV